MNAEIKAQLEKVDGVEVFDEAPEGAAVQFGPFYGDQIALLIRTARDLRERSKHLIAPAIGGGFAIFAKPTLRK